MDSYHVRVTSKGQVTLPKALRKELRISKGDYLEVRSEGGKWVVEPIRKKTGLQLLMEYARTQSKGKINLEEAHRILGGLPFSMSDEVTRLREEGEE